MKMASMKKCLSILLCMVLVAAMALCMVGCGGLNPSEETVAEVSFTFVAVDLDGNETNFELSTNKSTVGEALQEEGLIAGEMGDYGLYVNTVNGITLDWDKDQKYWAFYVDGEYALSGVDSIEVSAGSVYTFKPE